MWIFFSTPSRPSPYSLFLFRSLASSLYHSTPIHSIYTCLLFLRHCSAFHKQHSKHLNITISVSFGITRELGFIRKKQKGDDCDCNCHVSFPQINNMVFTFGRDVNIRYMHGIDAILPNNMNTPVPSSSAPASSLSQKEEDRHQQPTGRISIIIWGYAEKVIEEYGSPKLLVST